jgi:hypothetical protein
MENAEWVKKLQIEVHDEDDGSATIQIEWDENDPDLQWWTQLGKEGQETFVIDAFLWAALECYMDDDLTTPVD